MTSESFASHEFWLSVVFGRRFSLMKGAFITGEIAAVWDEQVSMREREKAQYLEALATR